jgi:hypothetical protein
MSKISAELKSERDQIKDELDQYSRRDLQLQQALDRVSTYSCYLSDKFNIGVKEKNALDAASKAKELAIKECQDLKVRLVIFFSVYTGVLTR